MKCGYDYSRDLGAKPFSLENAVCELPAEWRVTWDDETFSYACDFEFTHPYGRDPLEFARDLVIATYGDEHVKDLDWDACDISDD